MVWIDPDQPEELFDRWYMSCRRPAPMEFRRRDYGTEHLPPSSETVRQALAEVLGDPPDGPVRMLTQPRRWGWLFNPLTLYFAWSESNADRPVGVVAEVTNTPWKERYHYAVPLTAVNDSTDVLGAKDEAWFDKGFHVSPFLPSNLRYHLIVYRNGKELAISLNVYPLDDQMAPAPTPTLETRLSVFPTEPTSTAKRRFVLSQPFSTHRVSIGIHTNAARLWKKGVPYVAHPKRQAPPRQEPDLPPAHLLD